MNLQEGLIEQNLFFKNLFFTIPKMIHERAVLKNAFDTIVSGETLPDGSDSVVRSGPIYSLYKNFLDRGEATREPSRYNNLYISDTHLRIWRGKRGLVLLHVDTSVMHHSVEDPERKALVLLTQNESPKIYRSSSVRREPSAKEELTALSIIASAFREVQWAGIVDDDN